MKNSSSYKFIFNFIGLNVLAVSLIGAGFYANNPEQQIDLSSHQYSVPVNLVEEFKRKNDPMYDQYSLEKQVERMQIKEFLAQNPNTIDPVIEFMVDQTDKMNEMNKLLGVINNVGQATCVECQKAVSEIKYMTCNSKNNYLEKELENIASGESSILKQAIKSDIRANSIIKPVCMRMSMESRFGANNRSFRTCSPGQNQAGASTYRPCISENYFKMTQNSFDIVSSCLKDYLSPDSSEESQKMDVRAAYAMINIESGFHVNAMSPTGAGGIGQFTYSAIEDINRNQFSKVKEVLNNNESPVCQSLSEDILKQPMKSNIKNSCDRIAISKGNPMKNMIYTFAYMKSVKKILNNVLFENKFYQNKFSRLSNEDLEKVRRAMVVWSHNAGAAGIMTPVKALLNSKYRNTPVTDAGKFIAEVQRYLQIFPASANSSTSRRKETSSYFPAISSTLNQIEQNAGGGSCIN